MQEQDRARLGNANGPFHDHLNARTGRIPHSMPPAYGPLTERPGDRCHPRTAKAVRRAKVRRAHAARVDNSLRSELQVISHIARRLEMQLAVIVAVIANRVALAGDAAHEIGPPLRVTSENEKRRLRAARREGVEYRRGRVGIRSIVESERDDRLITLDVRDDAT